MANIKRMVFKRFGGGTNFILFLLVTASCYVLVRNYLFTISPGDEDAFIKNNQPSFSKDLHGNLDKKNSNEKVTAAEKIKQPENVIPTEIKTDPGCEIEEKCTANSVPYKLISGEGMDKYPTICFNGKLLVHKDLKENKIGRGVNMVILKKDTYEVKSIDNFDTFVDDAPLYRKLKSDTVDGDIILVASYDEMANALRETTIKVAEFFGSQLFGNVKFRDSFVMIGQRGVAKGKALELIEPKKNKDFASLAKISGCANFPLGLITPVKINDVNVITNDQIETKFYLKDCGMKESCQKNEFAVHVYTGKDKNDEPKICVDGRYVIAKGINDAGRGLNLVVVGNGKEVLKIAHFDTYGEDSTNLEIFLEGLYDNVILIAVTFDEASTKLSTLARNLFYELGSGLIQNLKHRDAWYLVGRRGIKGFSPLEEISYAGPENAYPKVLDKHFCVPQTLKGTIIRPDPLPVLNDKRRDFCSRFDGYGDFCIAENVDKPLMAAPIINKTLEDHPVYDMPIVVVGAMSHNSLRMTLETIIMQPGIRAENVYVCLDEKLTELTSLVELFGFHYVKIASSFNYTEILHKSLAKIFDTDLIETDKENIIVIEEELILSPDFLYFFSQLYEIYANDPSIAAISSFNPNSYNQVEGNSSYVYRTNEFPGLGFMMKKTAYDRYMKGNMYNCCGQRAWYNWKTVNTETKANEIVDVLVPDVSRVFRRPYDISSSDFSFLDNLFNRKRKTNLIPFPELVGLEQLIKKETYVNYLKEYLTSASNVPNVDSCYKESTFVLPITNGVNYKIIYDQTGEFDLSNLKKLCKCFNLFADESQPPKGLYEHNILRFNSKHNNYVLIGSKNPILTK